MIRAILETMACGPRRSMGWSDGEIRRWLLLRAVEWAAWPSFVSQVFFPIAALFFAWSEIIPVFILANVIWFPIRHRYVNVTLASVSFWFVKTKWPITIACIVYFFTVGRYLTGVFLLLWSAGLAGIGLPRSQVGLIELRFAEKIGYISE